jgi:hypothetical protein
MYRCYLIRNGHIAMGEDLCVETPDEAMDQGRRLLAAQPKGENFSGIEIWRGATLLYYDRNTRDISRMEVGDTLQQ